MLNAHLSIGDADESETLTTRGWVVWYLYVHVHARPIGYVICLATRGWIMGYVCMFR
jgi:hypothetical protein